VIVAAGDGDVHEVVPHLVENENVSLVLVGSIDTVSEDLRPYASAVIEMGKKAVHIRARPPYRAVNRHMRCPAMAIGSALADPRRTRGVVVHPNGKGAHSVTSDRSSRARDRKPPPDVFLPCPPGQPIFDPERGEGLGISPARDSQPFLCLKGA